MSKKEKNIIKYNYIEQAGDLSLDGMPGRVHVRNDDIMVGAVTKYTPKSAEYKVVFFDDTQDQGKKAIHYEGPQGQWGILFLPGDAKLNLRAGDRIRVFYDGRGKADRPIAVTNLVGMDNVDTKLGKKQMCIYKVPYADNDIKNFMHRYLPRLSDKVKFSWALLCMVIVEGGRLHVRPAENLRTVLENGPRNKYLAQFVTQGNSRQK